MTSADIIAIARACLGTPFRHQGRIPGVALDCAGLVVAVAAAPRCRLPGPGGLRQIAGR